MPKTMHALSVPIVTVGLFCAGLLAAAELRAELSPPLRVQVMAKELEQPWAFAFLPDGRVLITERAGQLRVWQDGKLLAEPVKGMPEVYDEGQGGLLDVQVDADFERNKTIYFSYAYRDGEGNHTRVERAMLDRNALQARTVLFTSSPGKGTSVHYGGRLLMLPGRELLLGLGDGFDYREAAQDLRSDLGKVISIQADGSANQGRELAKIYSLGHRNVQGLVYSSRENWVYAHEHGPQGGDEINRLQRGGNYGWPLLSYGLDYTGARVTPLAELPDRPDLLAPVLHWTPSIAPSGMAIYEGSLFPDWQGDLLVSTLVGRELRRVKLRDGKVLQQESLLKERDQRWRDIRVAADGSVWLLSDGEQAELLRITPKS